MNTTRFNISHTDHFIQKMLNWADRFGIFCFLNGNGYDPENSFPVILAAGARRELELTPGAAFSALKSFHQKKPSWLFGHLSYDLMTETLQVASRHQPDKGFGYGFFFEPEILIRISDEGISISCDGDASSIFSAINAAAVSSFSPMGANPRPAYARPEYESIIVRIQEHIRRGDCYELNFCQPFYSEKVQADPVSLYLELNRISPNPFSSLYKLNGNYCLCASPERFLRKSGSRIFSQPMKGTARRHQDPEQDEALRNQLFSSAKERSENVMIVDLVRNDLSKCAQEGSVEVSELFGIRSYPWVHQMVSTVRGLAKEDCHWTDILSSCFPMGSMTGAPKKRVAELIDRYEFASRGLFSGTIGYVDPSGDFDMNVVIRSMFYNHTFHQIRFWVGGGITFYSKPESEYEECLLKARAMLKVLTGS